MVLESSSNVHLGGFGVAFGCHLGSLFDTFGAQGPFWDAKVRVQNVVRKTVKNGIYSKGCEFDLRVPYY